MSASTKVDPSWLKVIVKNDASITDADVEKAIRDGDDIIEGPVNLITLSWEEAKYHIDRVQRCNLLTWPLLRIVFPELPTEFDGTTADKIRSMSQGIRHIAGLIELTLGIQAKHGDKGLAFHYIHPEAFLHPKYQCAITDLVLKLHAMFTKGEEVES